MERAYVFSRTADGREYVVAEIESQPWIMAEFGSHNTPLTRSEAEADAGKVTALAAWDQGDGSVAEDEQRQLDEEQRQLAAMTPTEALAEFGRVNRSRHLSLVK